MILMKKNGTGFKNLKNIIILDEINIQENFIEENESIFKIYKLSSVIFYGEKAM